MRPLYPSNENVLFTFSFALLACFHLIFAHFRIADMSGISSTLVHTHTLRPFCHAPAMTGSSFVTWLQTWLQLRPEVIKTKLHAPRSMLFAVRFPSSFLSPCSSPWPVVSAFISCYFVHALRFLCAISKRFFSYLFYAISMRVKHCAHYVYAACATAAVSTAHWQVPSRRPAGRQHVDAARRVRVETRWHNY